MHDAKARSVLHTPLELASFPGTDLLPPEVTGTEALRAANQPMESSTDGLNTATSTSADCHYKCLVIKAGLGIMQDHPLWPGQHFCIFMECLWSFECTHWVSAFYRH